MLPHGLTSA